MPKWIGLFMGSSVFLDTSGLFAFLVKKDERHKKASMIVRQILEAGGRFVTTDYVIDETATLLKARGYDHAIANLFEGITSSKACRLEWMDHDQFDKTKALFLKYCDHSWSFTDCLSFIALRRIGLKEALTHDEHFREAGFTPLLC
jgi:predicted nucleic acid-binding protein